MPKMEDIENDQLNVLEIIVEHRVDEHIIEEVTLYRTEVDQLNVYWKDWMCIMSQMTS